LYFAFLPVLVDSHVTVFLVLAVWTGLCRHAKNKLDPLRTVPSIASGWPT